MLCIYDIPYIFQILFRLHPEECDVESGIKEGNGLKLASAKKEPAGCYIFYPLNNF